MHLKFYARFFEQLFKRIVGIAAKSDKALYFGIHQHLGAEYAGRMGNINCGTSEADAMKRCLDNHILLRVNRAAYFLSRAGLDMQLISEAAKFKTILEPCGSSIITSGQYMLISNGDSTHMMAQAS